jgi:hypothetical protein
MLNTTFLNCHIEYVGLSGANANVIYLITSFVKFINLFVEDVQTISGASACSMCTCAGYNEYVSFDRLFIKWNSYSSGVVTQALPIIGAVAHNGNDTNPITRIDNMYIEDDAGNNLQYVTLDSVNTTALGNGTAIAEYIGDNLLPTTRQYQPVITSSYTHYGLQQDAVIFVPASLSGAITVTLSNKRKPSGTGSSLITKTGNTVRIRRQSGTFAGTLTVVDAASSGTLSTNSTAAVDLLYQFNGTNWIVAT